MNSWLSFLTMVVAIGLAAGCSRTEQEPMITPSQGYEAQATATSRPQPRLEGQVPMTPSPEVVASQPTSTGAGGQDPIHTHDYDGDSVGLGETTRSKVVYLSDGNPCVRQPVGPTGGGTGQFPYPVEKSSAVLLEVDDFEGTVKWTSFSPDGQAFATLSEEKIRFLDSVTGVVLGQNDHPEGISSPAFGPDGQQFGAIIGGNSLHIWDWKTGQLTFQLTSVPDVPEYFYPTDYIRSFAFSPDGRYLATAQSFSAWIWDAESGQELWRLEGELVSEPDAKQEEIANGHGDIVTSLAFTPNGQALLTAGADGTVRMWDVESGEHLRCYEEGVAPTSRLRSVAVSPDGLSIMSHDYEHVYVWESTTGESRQIFDEEDFPDVFSWFNSARFSPDSQRIVTTNMDGTAREWYLESGQLLALLRHPNWIFWADYSPDGESIVTALGPEDNRGDGPLGAAWIWDVGHQDLRLAAEALNMVGEGIQLALSGDYEVAFDYFREAQALNPNPEYDLEALGRERAADLLEETIRPLINKRDFEAGEAALLAAMPLFRITNWQPNTRIIYAVSAACDGRQRK